MNEFCNVVILPQAALMIVCKKLKGFPSVLVAVNRNISKKFLPIILLVNFN